MSTLSPTEQLLFDAAKRSLPKVLFSEPGADELLAAFAKAFALTWDQCGIYLDGTRINTADEVQIEQHAKDRGTRRRVNEPIDTLRARLRFLEDQVTPAAIVAAAALILQGAGISVAGYPGLVELRRDRAFLQRPRLSTLSSIALSVTPQGTPGATAYSYAVLPQLPHLDGGPTVQPLNYTASTSTGNATLNSTNFNRASWIGHPNAIGYDVFRYASSGTPSSTGLIGTTTGTTFDDTGIAADGSNYLTFARLHSYVSRGFRVAGTGREAHAFIVILPYDATAELEAAVEEMVRMIKAGGVQVIVERRASP
jgi:hypothetical protein